MPHFLKEFIQPPGRTRKFGYTKVQAEAAQRRTNQHIENEIYGKQPDSGEGKHADTWTYLCHRGMAKRDKRFESD